MTRLLPTDGEQQPRAPTTTCVEPALRGCAAGRFHGWVIGGAHPAALAVDRMVSTWDQNAALAACSPAEAS